MAAFARWTNLSETTFLLPPTDPRRRLPGAHLHAGRRVALRRPPHARQLPCLAGGRRPAARGRTWSAGMRRRAWCACGATARARLRRAAAAAQRAAGCRPAGADPRGAGLDRGRRARRQWVDNGPGWCRGAARFAPRRCWRCGRTGRTRRLKLGVVGVRRSRDGAEVQFEVRALIGGGSLEDPVTGSLNAQRGAVADRRRTGAADLRRRAGRGAGAGRARGHRERRRHGLGRWRRGRLRRRPRRVVSAAQIDHLVVAADTLAQGVAWCDSRWARRRGRAASTASWARTTACWRSPRGVPEGLPGNHRHRPRSTGAATARWFGLDGAALRDGCACGRAAASWRARRASTAFDRAG